MRTGLDGMQQALEVLLNPQATYSVIHVAGTNGKGTVCHLLSQILSYQGYKVGLVMSPHVNDYRERIQISHNQDLTMISKKHLIQVHESVLSRLPVDHQLTYFEWGVLLALEYFKQQKVDFAVLETGLGGRWDATNVCESVLSAITTIGLDHTEILGDTKEKILEEKLQIIKSGSDFLFCPEDKNLAEQAKKVCLSKKGIFYHFSDFENDLKNLLQEFSFENLKGYQYENLQYALAMAKLLKKKGVDLNLKHFLKNKNLSWPPARLQFLSKEPVILMDGAHNLMGLKALKKVVQKEFGSEYDLIFGTLNNRPFLELASLMRSDYDNYWVRFSAGQRETSEDIYKQAQQQYGGYIFDLDQDLKKRLSQRKIKRPIVLCGSFYLCSQFRDLWES